MLVLGSVCSIHKSVHSDTVSVTVPWLCGQIKLLDVMSCHPVPMATFLLGLAASEQSGKKVLALDAIINPTLLVACPALTDALRMLYFQSPAASSTARHPLNGHWVELCPSWHSHPSDHRPTYSASNERARSMPTATQKSGSLMALSIAEIIHPPKQTWNLKMDPWKRRFLLETIISRFHVIFWGCIRIFERNMPNFLWSAWCHWRLHSEMLLYSSYAELLQEVTEWSHKSGQIIIFHQPRFPWSKGSSLTKPPFGVRSCEVAIIWPDKWLPTAMSSATSSTF